GVDHAPARDVGTPSRSPRRLPRKRKREREKIMSQRTTRHNTFVIERSYDAPLKRVFHAWADPDAKRNWFACHDDWQMSHYELDFRVDGRERLRTADADGVV